MSNSNYDGDHYSDDPIDFEQPKPKKRVSGILALVAALVGGTLYVQTTLASNISLNTGPVEFGQGVAQLTACDSAITVTPYSSFVNGNPGAFKLSGVKLSQVDTTSQSSANDEGCAGKTFSIKVYKENGDLFQPIYSMSVSSTGVFASSDGTITASGQGGENGSATLLFRTKSINSTEVYTITIETIGVTGGVIFGYTPAGFACGPTLAATCHYLELAPANWYGPGNDPELVWSIPSKNEILVPAYNELTPTNRTRGAGLSATLAIINQNGLYNADTNNYAAGAANAYRGGGYTNWNLPNVGEADALASEYSKLVSLGYDIAKEYWNSNECGATGAYKITVNPDGQFYAGGCDGKGELHPVRPVRAF